jgi:hypothetical protein
LRRIIGRPSMTGKCSATPTSSTNGPNGRPRGLSRADRRNRASKELARKLARIVISHDLRSPRDPGLTRNLRPPRVLRAKLIATPPHDLRAAHDRQIARGRIATSRRLLSTQRPAGNQPPARDNLQSTPGAHGSMSHSTRSMAPVFD